MSSSSIYLSVDNIDKTNNYLKSKQPIQEGYTTSQELERAVLKK